MSPCAAFVMFLGAGFAALRLLNPRSLIVGTPHMVHASAPARIHRAKRPDVPFGSLPRLALAILLFAPLAGCASAPVETAPPIDTEALVREAEAASALEGAHRLVFQWSLSEPGMRVSGRGVARIEDPYRARIDLFASNGERIAAAGLVGDDLHVPEGMPNVIPETTLLWASLGVFRPGRGMAPEGGTLDGDERAELRYRVAGGGRLVTQLVGRRIQNMELEGTEGVRQEVRLEFASGERFPRQTVYRHHGEVRELRLVLEEVEPVERYPSDIWTPGEAR